MRNLFYFAVSLLLLVASVTFVGATTTEEVVALVEQTKEAMEKNAFQTLAKINMGEHPYKDLDNPSLYVFVFRYRSNFGSTFQNCYCRQKPKR